MSANGIAKAPRNAPRRAEPLEPDGLRPSRRRLRPPVALGVGKANWPPSSSRNSFEVHRRHRTSLAIACRSLFQVCARNEALALVG
jgi:hypothetical protein